MTGFTSEAIQVLEEHHWPRNVRDLQDLVNRVTVRAEGSRVEKTDIEQELDAMAGYAEAQAIGDAKSLAELERVRIGRALSRSEGKRGQAALLLGTTRPVIDRLIVQYDLAPSVETSTDPHLS
jgi:DNA-binding NtrC family response regulator